MLGGGRGGSAPSILSGMSWDLRKTGENLFWGEWQYDRRDYVNVRNELYDDVLFVVCDIFHLLPKHVDVPPQFRNPGYATDHLQGRSNLYDLFHSVKCLIS